MSVSLVQNVVGTVPVYLEQTGCIPKTGLLFTDVTVSIRKGTGSFVTKSLVITDWTEVGGGYYFVTLSTTDTNTLGDLYVRVNGATFNTAIVACYVSAVVVPTPPTVIPVPQTIVYGYIYDATGAPAVGVSVQATILAIPTVLHPGTDGLTVTTSMIVEKTDSSGYWQMSLIPLTQVDFSIPAVGYRRSVTVPSTTTNLFDII